MPSGVEVSVGDGECSIPDHSSSIWTEGIVKQDDIVRRGHSEVLEH